MQQAETQPCNVGPLSPSNNLAKNDNAPMSAFPIDLSVLGPSCTEIVHIPEEEEFDVNFVDSQENLHNAQVRTSESEDNSIPKIGEEESDNDKGGGGLEDMVWPPEVLVAMKFYDIQRRQKHPTRGEGGISSRGNEERDGNGARSGNNAPLDPKERGGEGLENDLRSAAYSIPIGLEWGTLAVSIALLLAYRECSSAEQGDALRPPLRDGVQV